MAGPKAILTGEGTIPVQGELKGFEHKRIPALERWADKFNDAREAMNGCKGEMENYALKIREVAHANADKLDHQEAEDGSEELVYKRADYNVVVKKGKETVNVKVKDASKGAPPEGDGADGADE